LATKTTDDTTIVDEVKERGSELVTTTRQQVGQKAGELGEDAAFQLREQVQHRSTQAGEQLQAVGQALRSGVEQLRTEGKDAPADFVDTIASKADQLGDYLKSADADRIIGDIEAFARRRPWLTAGATATVGFVVSRFLKSSSDRRYQQAYGVDGRSQPSYASRSLPAGAGE
jgi:ElaB/YqjD/DUF883 family membrane-anchored ribosome-binding protein